MEQNCNYSGIAKPKITVTDIKSLPWSSMLEDVLIFRPEVVLEKEFFINLVRDISFGKITSEAANRYYRNYQNGTLSLVSAYKRYFVASCCGHNGINLRSQEKLYFYYRDKLSWLVYLWPFLEETFYRSGIKFSRNYGAWELIETLLADQSQESIECHRTAFRDRIKRNIHNYSRNNIMEKCLDGLESMENLLSGLKMVWGLIKLLPEGLVNFLRTEIQSHVGSEMRRTMMVDYFFGPELMEGKKQQLAKKYGARPEMISLVIEQGIIDLKKALVPQRLLMFIEENGLN